MFSVGHYRGGNDPHGRLSFSLLSRLVLLASAVLCCLFPLSSAARTVSYDHRSLLLDGRRIFPISGSIHYPRSTPQMWPNLISLAKEGGLDAIDTYVFWNGHEAVRGEWHFADRYDLVGFVKAVQSAGLYVNLRLGPYISAEWNFGGFPEWLRELPGIEFRTDNDVFKAEMERFVSYIVELMRNNNLFYTQGGPIILTQIENEFSLVANALGDAGARYLAWTAGLVERLNITVPCTMCKQPNAPNDIIDTCNGFYCQQYTPNQYNKPKVWTENWTGWFHAWGTPLSHRPVQDIAYATALFFQQGGAFMNYYMYHGGTNFERTSAAGVTTSYDYDAPIDEYGETREPKYSHLKNLHAAMKQCAAALAAVDADAIHWSPTGDGVVEVYVYSDNQNGTSLREIQSGSTVCAAFISNSGLTPITIQLDGRFFALSPWSVSILPDCQNVVFNTAQVTVQTVLKQMIAEVPMKESIDSSPEKEKLSQISTTTRTSVRVGQLQWESYTEGIGSWGLVLVRNRLLEQINITDDKTDYLWYSTTVVVPPQNAMSAGPWLVIEKVDDIVRVFVNGRPADFVAQPTWNESGFYQPVLLQAGVNTISLLSVKIGLKYGGVDIAMQVGGLSGSITLTGGPFSVDLDISKNEWTHQVGLKGEFLRLETELGSQNVTWSSAPAPQYQPLVWYKTRMNAPQGDRPVVLDMGTMRKGEVWMNGHHLGRYWPQIASYSDSCNNHCEYLGVYDPFVKCLTGCYESSQRFYHVPREWMKPYDNLLVVFEEIGGDPSGISILAPLKLTICSNIQLSASATAIHLDCGSGYQITNVDFASYGDPLGSCGQFSVGTCHASQSAQVVREACVGRQQCSVQAAMIGEDPCPSVEKSIAVQARCDLS